MNPISNHHPLLRRIEEARIRNQRMRALYPDIECTACWDTGRLEAGTHLVADHEGGVHIQGKVQPCPICEKGREVERERDERHWHDRVEREVGIPEAIRRDAKELRYDTGLVESLRMDSGLPRSAYLYGGTGRGKSVGAAEALLRYIRSTGDVRFSPRRYGVYVTASDYLQSIRDTYDSGSGRMDGQQRQAGRTECITQCLVLDDLGLERSTEWGAEQICALIDHRTSNGKPTIFTSNLNLNEIERKYNNAAPKMGDRIRSRIEGACEVILVDGPDWRRK